MTDLTQFTVPQISVLAAVFNGCTTTAEIRDRVNPHSSQLHMLYRVYGVLCARKQKGRLRFRVSKRIVTQLLSIIAAHLTLGTPEIIEAMGY